MNVYTSVQSDIADGSKIECHTLLLPDNDDTLNRITQSINRSYHGVVIAIILALVTSAAKITASSRRLFGFVTAIFIALYELSYRI